MDKYMQFKKSIIMGFIKMYTKIIYSRIWEVLLILRKMPVLAQSTHAHISMINYSGSNVWNSSILGHQLNTVQVKSFRM